MVYEDFCRPPQGAEGPNAAGAGAQSARASAAVHAPKQRATAAWTAEDGAAAAEPRHGHNKRMPEGSAQENEAGQGGPEADVPQQRQQQQAAVDQPNAEAIAAAVAVVAGLPAVLLLRQLDPGGAPAVEARLAALVAAGQVELRCRCSAPAVVRAAKWPSGTVHGVAYRPAGVEGSPVPTPRRGGPSAVRVLFAPGEAAASAGTPPGWLWACRDETVCSWYRTAARRHPTRWQEKVQVAVAVAEAMAPAASSAGGTCVEQVC